MINNTEREALKAARKASREEEIATYGKPICWLKIVESKKKFRRKKLSTRELLEKNS